MAGGTGASLLAHLSCVSAPPLHQMIHRVLGGIFLLLIEPIAAEEDLKLSYNISNVVSVVPGPLPSYLQNDYNHLQISVTDEESSDLLLHLPTTNTFIDKALFGPEADSSSKKHQGCVLVHCAQGQSRSVSVIIAYLMYKYKLLYDQALHAVRRKVEGALPNSGFVEQLKVFQQMDFQVDKLSLAYKKFVIKQSLNEDPSGSSLVTSDVFANASTKKSPGSFRLRCRRCRHILATESDIEAHEMPDADSRQSRFIKTAPNSRRIVSVADAAKTCSHYFMDEPVDWMRPELDKQELEGKFACPKCESKVGGYSWRGSRCSCGKWMIPALHIHTAKVDQMKEVS